MITDRLVKLFSAGVLWGSTYVAHADGGESVCVGILLASAVVATLAYLEQALHSL